MLKLKKDIAGIGLLIFDLDGTLADTIESIREGLNMTLQKYGFPERSYTDVKRDIGNGARNLVRLSMPEERRHNDDLVDRILADYDASYGSVYLHCDCCYEGITDALKVLKDRGYVMAVLSNKQDPYVKGLVDALVPKGIMSVIMGQTALPKKPDPTVPLMIAEQLGFEPKRVAFIGDSDVDIFTGKNAGMLAVGCSWGYRDLDALEKAGADIIINSPTELIDVFK